ncbi:hypothetical protein VNO77_43122 [Canavalia gladiata]|uniref:Uncharacterized protein n=1 Tax=Canavalia gladiata TaxID=3824 RepID=A0AAN9JTH8_CANGL
MASQPEIENGPGHWFDSDDWRTRSQPNSMSISELVSELRDSFLSSDFDRVEETLVAREARLKAELEEKKKEIGSLKEKILFERLEKINAEFELKRLKQERCEEKVTNNNGFGLDGKIVKAEVESERVEALEEKKKLKSENQRKFCEEGNKVIGINGCGSQHLKRNEDGVGASGIDLQLLQVPEAEFSMNAGKLSARGKLGTRVVINVEDSDEDVCNSDRKETTSCSIRYNEHHRSSGQKNLPTGLAEPIGILKRKFAFSRELGANINNVLNGLDSDTSSSSSSSSSSSGSLLDMDSLPLTSNKKMRGDATSHGFNSSQR